ncbi:TfuA-like protein [Micromonospora sp. DT62]|uniref:TfuA-like protein n=1 Tax=Micromonospora sp. DT62 TaxID=3416521 RepID=UPI003CE88D94
MTGRRVVFVGPSLPADTRPQLDGEYLPPARHGDLFRLGLGPGDAALVVDGVYQHFAPLRHKEILATLSCGVRVFGAASMGALRAAELADCGMTPLGRVAAAYRTGELTSDADVAVLHSAEEDHRQLTVALVSVRFGVRDLTASGRLTPEHGDRLLRIAAGLHYMTRSPAALRADATAEGVGEQMAALLEHLAAGGDVKRQDALDAVRTLAGPFTQATTSTRWTSSYGTEWALDSTPLVAGSSVTRRRALACLQLFDTSYPQRHRAYVHRVVRDTNGAITPTAMFAAAGIDARTAANRFGAPTAATVGWSAEDRALVRTFRLPPGRCVYADLPPEATADRSPGTIVDWCTRLAGDGSGTRQWRELLGELWSAPTPQELTLSALERGFRDLDEALRLARPFSARLVGSLASAVAS